MEIEQHPLEPFLPANARLLMLGSFPPQRKRWSMEFYYPNWNNDMWRIVGLIFFGDKEHFVVKGKRAFSKDELIAFLQEKGIALYDTATAVRRLQDNASDKFLEVVQPTDVRALLEKLSQCRAIVTTGEKATETLCRTFALTAPKVGDFTEFVSKDVPCASTACPPRRVPTRWPWTRRRLPIGSCTRTCRCYNLCVTQKIKR